MQSIWPSLRGAKRRSNPSLLSGARWIASRSLSSGAHSRDPLARNDEEKPSLNRPEMGHLVGDLGGNRRGPWRAATPLDVDFHPEGFPSARWPDAVHGRGTLDASRMRGIEEHERFGAAGDLLDFLPQQTAILHDRLVGLAEMLAGAVLNRAHRFHRPLVVHVDVGPHTGVGRG